ncbi:MAG: DUF1059 domain-containing protein [Saprospiraceae bacterium]|nr:DUF1059 domain-containing protein [Bacteroidia bacterium]NNE15204.1 DUF1059 domain-containing protein [Saprospiraceae bacterium]NNL93229.1 DUF1059 domain-containing protein [Saprospiraceae bacterium]
MKEMTCKQLGGACDKVFTAETFEEMAEQSKQHGMEMYKLQDKDHLNAIAKMKTLMTSPADIQKWFENKRKEFDALSNL